MNPSCHAHFMCVAGTVKLSGCVCERFCGVCLLLVCESLPKESRLCHLLNPQSEPRGGNFLHLQIIAHAYHHNMHALHQTFLAAVYHLALVSRHVRCRGYFVQCHLSGSFQFLIIHSTLTHQKTAYTKTLPRSPTHAKPPVDTCCTP